MIRSPQRKVALVTGASAGIGKAIVRQLLQDGWIVYGAARRAEKMADIQAEGAKVLSLDVTSDRSMETAVEEILNTEGHIDALVNNAGYGSYGALEDVSIAEAKHQFEVNVFGLAHLTQLVLPAMRAAKSGTIVNISSMGGRIWMPMGGWYHATKHAVEVLSDALRVETRPFGIKVVVVQPGAIQSEWSGIAAQTLKKTSVDSAYQKMVEPMAKILEHYPTASSPKVVAKAVSKAVNSRNPRRRYATPLDAKVLIFLHWLLPDWAWESVIATVLK
ncbi:MAG: SDR family NAD(P)-dependent oxidoreductase [Acaryochloris sp. RU_4_1]|nr:SDR family NAD(P)-dependent oxidoreductase [Acaryochloris sp. RU_4_1]NJR54777.1 SDR family NAD(P)-dependent oxidoreductase [Acaryochloris sp. CRU_2_0]